MTYPSPDHDIEQHDRLHYPSSPTGGMGLGKLTEKQLIRIEWEKWWWSLSNEERLKFIEEEKERERDYYLYNQ